MLLTYARLDDIVINHHYQHLNSPDESAWRVARLIMLLVPSGTTQEDDNQYGNHYPYLNHVQE
jgi:hypothetical protein